jgi:hypothetical protein
MSIKKTQEQKETMKGRFVRRNNNGPFTRQNEQEGKVTPCAFPRDWAQFYLCFVGSVAGGSILS